MSTSQDQTPSYPPAAEADAYAPWASEPPRRRPWSRTVRSAVLTALVIAAAGLLFGVIWHVVAPTVPVLDAGSGGIVVNDPSPEEYIAADGWFTLIGLAFGAVAAAAAWMLRRPDRGPALLLGATIGALGGAVVAWQAGRRIGLSAYTSWRETATSGATYHAPPDLHTHGVLLVPAFAAAIVLTLLAGWSNDPNLDQPGAKPGYGRDLQHPDQRHSDQPYSSQAYANQPYSNQPYSNQPHPDQPIPDPPPAGQPAPDEPSSRPRPGGDEPPPSWPRRGGDESPR